MLETEDLGYNGIKVYQDENLYRFTSDAVVLAKFSAVKKGDVVADFCAGGGVVGLFLYALNPVIRKAVLFEMQKPLSDLSIQSIKLNSLENIFSAENVRLQDIGEEYREYFSLIVCNPPYMKVGAGFSDEQEHIALCRTEKALSVEELISSAAKCLKYGGRFNLVHRADRLAEVIYLLKSKNLEPKKLQIVRAAEKEPYLFLIEAVKGGKSGIKILPETDN